MSCTLDGDDLQSLDLENPGPISALTVYEGVVYFSTAKPHAAINRVSTGGTNLQELRTNTPSISAMKMFVSQRSKDSEGEVAGVVVVVIVAVVIIIIVIVVIVIFIIFIIIIIIIINVIIIFI